MWVDLNVVPSPFLRDVLASFDIEAQVVGEHDRPAAVHVPGARPAAPAAALHAQFRAALQRVLCAAGVRPHPGALSRRDADAGRGGSQEAALRAEAARLRPAASSRSPAASHRRRSPRYYADADIYVQTPSIDNMPLSVLEAFASGLPVVSTGVGGVPSHLERRRRRTSGARQRRRGDRGARAEAAATSPRTRGSWPRPHTPRCAAYEWPVVREGWLRAYRQVAGGPPRGR